MLTSPPPSCSCAGTGAATLSPSFTLLGFAVVPHLPHCLPRTDRIHAQSGQKALPMALKKAASGAPIRAPSCIFAMWIMSPLGCCVSHVHHGHLNAGPFVAPAGNGGGSSGSGMPVALWPAPSARPVAAGAACAVLRRDRDLPLRAGPYAWAGASAARAVPAAMLVSCCCCAAGCSPLGAMPALSLAASCRACTRLASANGTPASCSGCGFFFH